MTAMPADVHLVAHRSVAARPAWPGAVWVGEFDSASPARMPIFPIGVAGYHSARVLVREGRLVRGFAEAPVSHERVDLGALAAAVDALPAAAPTHSVPAPLPHITVAICTRHRPDQLRSVLRDALVLDYPSYSILVVDNGPDDDRTRWVAAAAGSRVRVAVAPVPGLSRARNIALAEADSDLVAFTDDDVVLDPGWLHGIADGFARAAGVACVTGLVPSIELDTPAQCYFDARVNWASSCEQDVFDARQKRPGEPLFPFRVGRYGTGANFAVNKQVVAKLGGFDEAMGAGSRTGGGEDIDMFVRLLLAGHRLAYEPSAVVWHRHRSEEAELVRQIGDYGCGLGAWLTKLALQPRIGLMLARRMVPAAMHLARITHVEAPVPTSSDTVFAGAGRVERAGIARGPWRLLQARATGARSRPLAEVKL
jgi:GT2 family glycosyltransferase